MQETLPLLSDSALLRLYHQGDQRAFEQLVERYHPHLFCYLMKVLRDSDMVGDVMQHVWIQCAFAPSSCLLADTPSLRGWLFQVARNKAIDLHRRRAREKVRMIPWGVVTTDADDTSHFLWLQDSRPGPELLVEQREMYHALEQAIATLPQTYQQIVYFRLWHQLSYRYIGQRLGLPVTSVKTYFHRSRLRLSKALGNWRETGVLPEKRKRKTERQMCR